MCVGFLYIGIGLIFVGVVLISISLMFHFRVVTCKPQVGKEEEKAAIAGSVVENKGGGGKMPFQYDSNYTPEVCIF